MAPEYFPKCKFNMVLCELFNSRIHGIDDDSDPTVTGHYLVHSRYHNYRMINAEKGTFIKDESFKINEILPCLKAYIRNRGSKNVVKHDFIRNYKNIISHEKYIKPEIAECIYLSGGECVAILKTFWIRIIQRAWKRVYKERTDMIREWYKNPAEKIRQRQTSFTTQEIPGLRGMLLSKK